MHYISKILYLVTPQIQIIMYQVMSSTQIEIFIILLYCKLFQGTTLQENRIAGDKHLQEVYSSLGLPHALSTLNLISSITIKLV
jgi:hypothetical protein